MPRCAPGRRRRAWTAGCSSSQDAAFAIDPAAHDPERRAAAGPDVIAIGVSAALGIDRLPAAEAAELAAAWHEGAFALGGPFAVWATGRDPDALRAALDQGAIGLELAADALVAPDAFDTLAPLLQTLGDRPLFVHPGPSADPGRDGWWTPVVGYVSQLHAAWWAWADGGRERFPQLPVLFAALAGLGPLHGERYRARGGRSGPDGPADLRRDLELRDTSRRRDRARARDRRHLPRLR